MNKKLKIALISSALIAGNTFAVDKMDDLETSRMIFTKEIWEKNQENPLAQLYIAEQHYLQDEKDLALKWYLKSALNKNESAQNNALLMIELGEGVDANMDDVVSFLEKIGLEGNLFAQTFLGDIYRLGEYHQNLEKSYFWYSEAAKQGDDRSQYFVGTMSVNGIGTYQNIPKGMRVLESLAEKGNVNAMYILGKINKIGFNVTKNHKEAAKWFEMAAKEGNVEAMYEIADSLERGYGVSRDSKKALEWFETSAHHGFNDAAYRSGLLYLELSIMGDAEYTVDFAKHWLEIAANEGSVEAQQRLGDLYYDGKYNVDKDYKEAEKWYKLAASQGDRLSYKKLSLIYRVGGYGTKRDDNAYKEAIRNFYTMERKQTISSKVDKSDIFGLDAFNY